MSMIDHIAIGVETPKTKSYKYVFSYILDDRIIDSWCLNILNILLHSMYFAIFNILMKILGGLLISYPNNWKGLSSSF